MAERIAEESQKRQKDATERAVVGMSGRKNKEARKMYNGYIGSV